MKTIRELADLHHLSKSGIRLYIDRLPPEHKSYELRRGQSVIVVDNDGAEMIAGWIAENAPHDRTEPNSVHTVDSTPHRTAQLPHSERKDNSTAQHSTSTPPHTAEENTVVCTPHTTAQLAEITAQTAITALTDQITAKDQQIAAKDNQIAELQAALATAQRTISTQTDAISRMVDYQHQLEAAAQEPHMKYRRGFMLFLKRRKSDD